MTKIDTLDVQQPKTSGVNVRRIAATTVLTLVVLEILARLVSSQLPDPLLWPRYEVQQKVDQLDELGQDGCIDIAIFGSSIANAAIDAAVVEESLPGAPRVYNASLGGAGIDSAGQWAEEVVFPTVCPRQVIIGFSVRDLNDAGGDSEFLPRYQRSLGRAERLGTATLSQRITLAATDRIGLVQMRPVLRNPASTYAWLRNEGGQWRVINDDHGTLTRFRNRPYDDRESRRIVDRRNFADYAAGGVRADRLATFIEQAQAEGYAVALVMLPYTRDDTIELLPRGEDDIAAYEAAVAGLGNETGADVIDLSAVATTREWFADDYHINGDGARLVSLELAAELERLGAGS